MNIVQTLADEAIKTANQKMQLIQKIYAITFFASKLKKK